MTPIMFQQVFCVLNQKCTYSNMCSLTVEFLLRIYIVSFLTKIKFCVVDNYNRSIGLYHKLLYIAMKRHINYLFLSNKVCVDNLVYLSHTL